ncbi:MULTISPECIES: trehalose-phosphatase [Anaeromyxobacter]|uniref:trehalose-phosphatase n=1 Tax=Anaeromyxobacter TaxID=161492 RepID=UPI001F562D88|nr:MULTISPECIES: trehalose-phosphatase [unclassified Anaeromyxobacter]
MIPDLLAAPSRQAIAAIAHDRALLAFDFDGTLAPIVDEPGRALMRPDTRALLRVAALLYPCVVVSGRSRADLAPRLEGVPLVAWVGNHGAEAGFGPVDRSPRGTVLGWRAALTARLGDLPGVEIEDKGLSIAIHYRRAAEPAAAELAIREAAATLPGARVFGGHAVVNAVPADAPTKGDAIAELLERSGCRTALYVGDDATDEDAFRAPGVVGVVIGASEASAAAYRLASQDAIDDLLRLLVEERSRLDGRESRAESLARAVQPER